MNRTRHGACVVVLSVASSMLMSVAAQSEEPGRWPIEKAAEWGRAHPWLAGCNFIPSTAINQLEMWQAETFDLETIDRELGWAEDLGFNSIRVFLHNLLWQRDAPGFLTRIEQFVAVADRHKIGVVFVLFDGVWDPFPEPGKQRDPKPGVHNSGWVQSPGAKILADPRQDAVLKEYVTGVIGLFKSDARVYAWDLFNEPENPNRSSYGRSELGGKSDLALALLTKTAAWAREVNPSQPLTAGVWQGDWSEPGKLSPINRVMLEQSDVISFHNYQPLAGMKKNVESLRRYRRPILCTEYMARPAGSRFDPILAYLKEQKVGAYNWGFVAGKTQTIYPWDSWAKAYTAEPKVWFHDIFRPDGSPFDAAEVSTIRKITGKSAAPP